LYALTVHSSSSIEAPRSSRIVLSAVDTTSVSNATISDAIEVSARIHLCARFEVCVLSPMIWLLAGVFVGCTDCSVHR
jgi:hypothetical protein